MIEELPYRIFYPLGHLASSLFIARGIFAALATLVFGPLFYGGLGAYPRVLIHAGFWLALGIVFGICISRWKIEFRNGEIVWGIPGFRSKCMISDITHITEGHSSREAFVMHTERGMLTLSVFDQQTHANLREFFSPQGQISEIQFPATIRQNFRPALWLLAGLVGPVLVLLGARELGLSEIDMKLTQAGLIIFNASLMMWVLELWRPQIRLAEDSISYLRDIIIPDSIQLSQVQEASVKRVKFGALDGKVVGLTLKAGRRQFEVPTSLPYFPELAEQLLTRLPEGVVIKDG